MVERIVGLAKTHAFIDSNKRAAFLAMRLLLFVNAHRLNATQADEGVTMLAVAEGEIE